MAVCAGTANAAVFVLKGVTVTANDGAGPGTYSVTGEFKVDTSVPIQSPSAWNININSISGSSSLNRTFVKNTTGFTDNSYADGASTNANSFEFCTDFNTNDCSYSIAMSFDTNFINVYQDGTNSLPPIPGTGSTTLTAITLKSGGNLATTSTFAGQADFVPFSPAFVGFLPVTGLLLRLKRKHSVKVVA